MTPKNPPTPLWTCFVLSVTKLKTFGSNEMSTGFFELDFVGSVPFSIKATGTWGWSRSLRISQVRLLDACSAATLSES